MLGNMMSLIIHVVQDVHRKPIPGTPIWASRENSTSTNTAISPILIT
jgi:hypothetical protein